MQLLSTETKERVFTVYAHMTTAEFDKELQAVLEARSMYMENHLVDSLVFTYIDDVYEIILDVLVYKHLSK